MPANPIIATLPLWPQSAPRPLSAEQLGTLRLVQQRASRLMSWALTGGLVMALALAPLHGTWLPAVLVAPALVLIHVLALHHAGGTLLTSALGGVLLATMAGLHAIQLRNDELFMIAALGAITLMIAYVDWRAIWPGVGVLLITRSVTPLLQTDDPMTSAGAMEGLFRTAGIVVHGLIATFFAVRQRAQLLESGVRQADLRRLALVAERTQNAVIISDASGATIWINEGFTRATGYTLADMLGKKPGEVLSGAETDPATVAAIRAALRAGRPFDGELYNYTKEGRGYWKSVSITPIFDEQGERQGYISIETNIDERKRAERELRAGHKMVSDALEREKYATLQLAGALEELFEARQAADAASQAKSDFLANMSHEIRTPMTAILGFTDILLDPALSEEARSEAIQTIRRNGAHLLDLINDILDLSKIEAGKLTTERIPCSPCQLMAEAASLMRPRADSKGLDFSIEFDGPMPGSVQTDPSRLRQILLNLLSNAIKFTESGEVRVVATLLGGGDASDASSGRTLQIQVVDTGIGMTPEQLARVFKPFTQADTSTTRRFGGTGLGLTISKHLAELLDGQLLVDSKYHRGSSFSIQIPTGPLVESELVTNPLESCRQTQAPTAPTVDPAARLDDCRLLLAEDGLDNQRLIAAVLRKAGATVTVVENGKLAAESALEQAAAGAPYDIILMDMQMPVLDGYSATSLLRRKGYTGTIIALTAHAMSTDRDKCIGAGCDDYATKPIDRKHLIRTIGEHFRKRAPVLAAQAT